MARPLLLLAAIAALTAGVHAMPALAQQPAIPAANADPLAIDLEAIPVQPVKGALSVKGVAGDDEDESDDVGRSPDHRDDSETAATHARHGADEDMDDD